MGKYPASLPLRPAGEHREIERKPSRLICLVTQASQAKWPCQAPGPADQGEFPILLSELPPLNLSVKSHQNDSTGCQGGKGKSWARGPQGRAQLRGVS